VIFSFGNLFGSPEKKRQRLLLSLPETAANAPLRQYLGKPLPHKRNQVNEIEFLALDFETTGINPADEAILSIGATLIKNGRVALSENQHFIVQVNRPLSEESVAIHKITDDRMHAGIHLHEALEYLMPAMAGRVLLVHHAFIERNFLLRACQQIYGVKPPLMIVDTLAIEKRKAGRSSKPLVANQLRLFNLRNQYNLPRYNAHIALEDALATAELFLAQTAHATSINESIQLGQVLSR